MSQIFSFQSHKIRTLTENNETWFVAADICASLGLKWTGHKLDMIPEGWQKLARYANFSRSLRFISEPAVYKLAFRSNKPEADAFTNWVACEVLPAIRKTGKFEAKPKRTPKALPAGNTEQEEYRIRRHREDLELAMKMVKIIGLEVAAQSEVARRVLRDRLNAVGKV